MPLPTPRLAPVTTATLPRNDDMTPSKPKDLALRRWGRGTADPREPGCPQVRSGVLFASPLLLDCRADLQGCMRGLRRCSMARAGPKGRVRGPWQPMPGSVRGCQISLFHCGTHPLFPQSSAIRCNESRPQALDGVIRFRNHWFASSEQRRRSSVARSRIRENADAASCRSRAAPPRVGRPCPVPEVPL